MYGGGGALVGCIFCLQNDGPITGGGGLISGDGRVKSGCSR